MLFIGAISETFRLLGDLEDRNNLFHTVLFYSSGVPEIRVLIGDIDEFIGDGSLEISDGEKKGLKIIRNNYALLANTLEIWNSSKESITVDQHRLYLGNFNTYHGVIFSQLQSLRNLWTMQDNSVFKKYTDEYMNGSLVEVPKKLIDEYRRWKRSAQSSRVIDGVIGSTDRHLSSKNDEGQ